MRVHTSALVGRPPAAVWPLLCDSRMTSAPRCPVFYVGTPKPVECRLPEGAGQVGAARQCVSDQGTVEQRITEWAPPSRLAFRMERTELAFGRLVDGVNDVFELQPADDGRATMLTRTTQVDVRGRLRCAKQAAIYVGIKAVHRFVFRVWREGLVKPAPPGGPPRHD